MKKKKEMAGVRWEERICGVKLGGDGRVWEAEYYRKCERLQEGKIKTVNIGWCYVHHMVGLIKLHSQGVHQRCTALFLKYLCFSCSFSLSKDLYKLNR